jgi:hypothetical protein
MHRHLIAKLPDATPFAAKAIAKAANQSNRCDRSITTAPLEVQQGCNGFLLTVQAA